MEDRELKFPTFESFKVWYDEKTRAHHNKTGKLGRFSEAFAQGKIPIGLLQEYSKQFYIFIQMTNSNLAWCLSGHADLWRRHPELYDIVAAKVGEELSDPGPGGHGRTYVKFARYLGLKDEDLFYAKPLPEMEARFNQRVNAYRSQRPAELAVSWMLEGFAGYSLKRQRDTLHQKYGVPDDFLEYFDIHVQADLEEHGPMGELLLTRLYKLGRVTEEDYAGMAIYVERHTEGAQPGGANSWQEVIYNDYYANHPQ